MKFFLHTYEVVRLLVLSFSFHPQPVQVSIVVLSLLLAWLVHVSYA